jgi:DNA (cytosine-5)-methyltransferase 1
MARTQPTVVSLFTGAGGLDIGLEQAGFGVVSAVEWDADCVATLRCNQAAGRTAISSIVHANVENVTHGDLVVGQRSRGFTPDLLVGGPPCQPFSSAGKGGSIKDPRGILFREFVRIASELKPRLILFENVRGLVTARGLNDQPGEVLNQVRQSFEDIGYATTFALLNAADFGVPQRRVRLFMMATRCTALPQFPEPTHAANPEQHLFGGSERWITLGEFLKSKPSPPESELVRPSAALAQALATVPEGSGLRSAGAREATRPGGHWGYRQGTFIADRFLPARTVTGSASQDWIRLPDGSLRRLSLAECAGLQGFPPDWEFVGSLASRFQQVGNAVPVMFGKVLGEALKEALARPSKVCPKSAAFPEYMRNAIAYTRREHDRNGQSRELVRRKLESGTVHVATLKGTGHHPSH